METPDMKGFIRDLFDDFPDAWPEGFDAQDLAEKRGVLVAHRVTEPCGDGCSCEDFHGSGEMAEGVTCYRLHESIQEPTP